MRVGVRVHAHVCAFHWTVCPFVRLQMQLFISFCFLGFFFLKKCTAKPCCRTLVPAAIALVGALLQKRYPKKSHFASFRTERATASAKSLWAADRLRPAGGAECLSKLPFSFDHYSIRSCSFGCYSDLFFSCVFFCCHSSCQPGCQTHCSLPATQRNIHPQAGGAGT